MQGSRRAEHRAGGTTPPHPGPASSSGRCCWLNAEAPGNGCCLCPLFELQSCALSTTRSLPFPLKSRTFSLTFPAVLFLLHPPSPRFPGTDSLLVLCAPPAAPPSEPGAGLGQTVHRLSRRLSHCTADQLPALRRDLRPPPAPWVPRAALLFPSLSVVPVCGPAPRLRSPLQASVPGCGPRELVSREVNLPVPQPALGAVPSLEAGTGLCRGCCSRRRLWCGSFDIDSPVVLRPGAGG